MSAISSFLREGRSFTPTPAFVRQAQVNSYADYERLYQHSVNHPLDFWAEQAATHLDWMRPWDEVCSHDFESIGTSTAPYVEWFKGGKLNVSVNCVDRHLTTARRNKAAIIWQGEEEHETRTLTYQELHRAVCRMANVLKRKGVAQGSTVTLFMPMIPELPIAMLACARLGAIHSVVFSAFSEEALRSRLADSRSSLVITADVGFHGGKVVDLKNKVDLALLECPWVQHVLVFNRGNRSVPMSHPRDSWLADELADPAISNSCEAEAFDAENPLFILYTSGSTGKPKGVLHTSAGYLLHTTLSTKYVFDLRDEDRYWCTADIGWITGHSYVVYGPLSAGATVLMFEGTPTYPSPDRFWKLISDYQVNIFYTAPTALRSLMRLGDELPSRHDLSSLRLLGTVGEPINPEAWMWYYKVIGKEQCPIVDTWWQTETGGIMITTLPGAMPMQPGSAGKPFFGVKAQVLREALTSQATQDLLLDEANRSATTDQGGPLVIDAPWPGMLRGVYGDAKHELVKQVYFSRFPGRYFTGDGCRIDEHGYHWLLGRIDDVINVSAHRFATAEIESALVSHSSVAEAAVVAVPHDTKGQGIYCYVTLKVGHEPSLELQRILIGHVRKEISPIATPEVIHFTPALPKTRSGKIMRRILRKIATGETKELGDISTLADPTVVDRLIESRP